jgi:hypothetical protein
VTTGGPTPTTSQVTDTYQNGRLASQSNQSGTLLATFTYDPSSIPELLDDANDLCYVRASDLR